MKTFGKKIVLKVLVQKPSGKNRFEALKSKILQKKNRFDYLISKILRKKIDLKVMTFAQVYITHSQFRLFSLRLL